MSEIETYRAQAKAWLESVAPKYARAARGKLNLSVEEDLALGRQYMAEKFDAGYAGINWPTEIGGQGLSNMHKIAFDSEEMQFGMPNGYFGEGAGDQGAAWRGNLVPAVLRAFGRV